MQAQPPPQMPGHPAPAVGFVGGPEYQAHKDAEHIKLLSIFHYVYAGLLAVGTLWPLIYVAMGLMMVSIPSSASGSPPVVAPPASTSSSSGSSVAPTAGGASTGAPATTSPASVSPAPGGTITYSSSGSGMAEAKFMGWMFFAIGVAMSLGFLVMAFLNFFAGRCMSARRKRIFILILSGLNTMAFPFGTAIGVFTFIVLLRPSVEALFEGRIEAIGIRH